MNPYRPRQALSGGSQHQSGVRSPRFGCERASWPASRSVRTVKVLAAGSARNSYDVTAQVFAAAVEDRVITSSPCRRIRLPKDDAGEVVPPTVEEDAALASAIGAR